MNWRSQFVLLLAIGGFAFQSRAQNPPVPTREKIPSKFSGGSTNFLLPPPLPQAQSPVDFFRKLLAMSPRELADSLTNRPPAVREKILAKVHEYQILPPDERELRLRATDLRWYLIPLFHTAPTNRVARLAEIPDNLRALVRSRLQQWDLLPPPIQQELLANDKALHYFSHVELADNSPPDPRQQKISEQFNQFFELTPAEKQETLNTLSAAERAEMEKTLKSLNQLPPPQRLLCVRNFSRFAGMSPAERAEFLKNAEHWSQMSPNERQTWRDLVEHVPKWPPMPPPIVPPIPHPMPPKVSGASMATN